MVPAFILSFLFITGAGMNILDIVDAFINNVGLVASGALEVILVGWFFDLESIRQEANRFSNFSIGKWWCYTLKIVTVVVLGIMIILNLISYIRDGYGGYLISDLAVFGWGAILFVAIAGTVLTVMKGKGRLQGS